MWLMDEANPIPKYQVALRSVPITANSTRVLLTSEIQLTENVAVTMRILTAVNTNPMFRTVPEMLKTNNG